MQRYCEQVREQRKLCCMPENAAKTNTDVSIRCVAVISFQIQKLQEDDKIPCTDVEFGAPLWVPAVKSVSLFLYSSMETGWNKDLRSSPHTSYRLCLSFPWAAVCRRHWELYRPTHVCLGQGQASRNGTVEPHVAAFPAAEALLSVPYLSPAASVCRNYRNFIIFRVSTSLLNWVELSQWICKWVRRKRSGRQGQRVSFVSSGDLSKKSSSEKCGILKSIKACEL